VSYSFAALEELRGIAGHEKASAIKVSYFLFTFEAFPDAVVILSGWSKDGFSIARQGDLNCYYGDNEEWPSCHPFLWAGNLTGKKRQIAKIEEHNDGE
jgi:murein tripeptide amidase MpaA